MSDLSSTLSSKLGPAIRIEAAEYASIGLQAGEEPFNAIPGFIWFFIKIAFILFLFIWVRGTFPRYRYDQLMRLGWKVFLPFSLFLGYRNCKLFNIF